MADINAEMVGANKPHKDANKSQKIESKEIKLRTEISDEVYRRAHMYEFTRRPFNQILIIIAVALLVQAFLTGTFTDPEVPLTTKLGIIVIALVTFVAMPLFVSGRWKFMRENNDFWVNNQRFTLNFKGLACVSNHGDRRLAWREFKKIVETDEAILFVLVKFHMVVIPTRGLNEDEKQQLRALIMRNTNGLRAKPKLKKTRRK